VRDATAARLGRLDVDGQPIPTLEELLRTFADACFTVDVKDPRCIGPLVEVLGRTGAAGRVCVAGAWDRRLQSLADRVGAELTTALGWRDLCALVTCAHARISAPRRVSGTFAHVPLSLGRLPVFGERLVARAAELGIGVVVWTVDDPAQMHRLLDAGVAGIITDRPDTLREVLVAREQWVAPTGHRPGCTPATRAGPDQSSRESYALREEQTEASAQDERRPSAAIRTTTFSPGTSCPTTVASPSGVCTCSPSAGASSANC